MMIQMEIPTGFSILQTKLNAILFPTIKNMKKQNSNHLYFKSKDLRNYDIQGALNELNYKTTTYSSIF
jgi:hypothetical protein